MQDTIETTSLLYRPIKIRLFTRRTSNDGSQLLSNFRYDRQKLGCYNILFQKRSTGKDEKGIDQCYKDMLGYAEQNNNAPLAIAMRKLYTSWQDSIKAVKTANELNTLQQKYRNQIKKFCRKKKTRLPQI